jgi:hypothetical protein
MLTIKYEILRFAQDDKKLLFPEVSSARFKVAPRRATGLSFES